jgi:uncharacterized protein (DUF169 family)
MKKNEEYAKILREKEGYERPLTAFKLCDTIPKDVEYYGDDISFMCAMVAEVWNGRDPFYITSKNVLCGGNVYAGIGMQHMTKERFDQGMETVIGPNKAYATRQIMRRVNQQVPKHFKHHKALIMGTLAKVDDPDLIMIVGEPHRIMRLMKAYTWKTGELTTGLQGTAWCAQTFPLPYLKKTLTYNLGDPPSRFMMGLKENEMYCAMHYSLLPLVIENLGNISSGEVM